MDTAKKFTIAVAVVGVILTLWGGLWGLLFTAVALSGVGSGDFMMPAILLLCAAYAAAGLGLLLKKPWGRQLTFGGTVAGLLLVLAGREAAILLAGFAAPFCSAAALLFFQARAAGTEIARPSKRVLTIGALLVVSITVFSVARGEIRQVLWDLRVDRWQSRCESSGDLEACGRYALELTLKRRDFADMRKGLALFDELCGDGVRAACKFTGHERSVMLQSWYRPDALQLEREERAARGCKQGNARACVVVADRGEQKLATKQGKKLCEQGEKLGCFAWVRSDPTSEEARQQACKAGFVAWCELDLSTRECLDGNWSVCADAAPDEAQTEIYEALAAVKARHVTNPALYGVSLAVPGLTEACAAGSAAACLGLGMNATADMNPFEHEAVPTRSLDATWGRACELGANAACYAYALRLLDRPFRETNRDLERAERLLGTACTRDHLRSCWLKVLELRDPSDGLDEYRRLVEQACEKSAPRTQSCSNWAAILAFDIDATPWPLVDSEAYHLLTRACRQHDVHQSCHRAAWMVTSDDKEPYANSTPPLPVQATSMVQSSCAGGYSRSCGVLFRAARGWSHLGLESESSLKAKICPQVPEACEEE
jgi:TPR repeat protein